MPGFCDIHHHILYGLDDGPDSYEKMTEMLCAAAKDGIEWIIATPHAQPGAKPFDKKMRETRLIEARAFCTARNLPIQIAAGAEIMVTPMLENSILNRDLPTLAGTRYVLIEFFPGVQYQGIVHAVKLLEDAGYLPILAHIERYSCLRMISRVASLKNDYDVMVQINCSAIVEKRSLPFRYYIARLLNKGLVDFVATDAHDTRVRKCRMREAYLILEAMAGKDYAYRLTGGAGQLILNAPKM